MCVRVEPVVLHQDSRSVFEPLEPECLPSQRNIHVVVTEPGCVRGNHYHTRGTEVITVQGPALVRIRDGQDSEYPDPGRCGDAIYHSARHCPCRSKSGDSAHALGRQQ